MLRRYFAVLLFSLLFVFTQHRVIAHEISHIHDPVSHSQKQDKSSTYYCDQCASHSGLGSPATSGFHEFSTLPQDTTFYTISSEPFKAHFKPSYFAQGPPTHS